MSKPTPPETIDLPELDFSDRGSPLTDCTKVGECDGQTVYLDPRGNRFFIRVKGRDRFYADTYADIRKVIPFLLKPVEATYVGDRRSASRVKVLGIGNRYGTVWVKSETHGAYSLPRSDIFFDLADEEVARINDLRDKEEAARRELRDFLFSLNPRSMRVVGLPKREADATNLDEPS